MTTAPLALAVALGLVVAVVAVLPRVDIRNPVVALLRVLVPSWRFFDAIAQPPDLLARVAGPDGRFGPWRPLLQPPRRAWWNLVWHPQGNLSLACRSLLDRLADDLDAPGAADRPEALVSYALVLDLVRWSLPDRGDATLVQFKLTDGPWPDQPEPEDLLVSTVHPL